MDKPLDISLLDFLKHVEMALSPNARFWPDSNQNDLKFLGYIYVPMAFCCLGSKPSCGQNSRRVAVVQPSCSVDAVFIPPSRRVICRRRAALSIVIIVVHGCCCCIYSCLRSQLSCSYHIQPTGKLKHHPLISVRTIFLKTNRILLPVVLYHLYTFQIYLRTHSSLIVELILHLS